MPNNVLKKFKQVEAALQQISKGMSVREAALKYQVCISTLQKNMQKNNIVQSKPTLEGLTKLEEDRLGNWLVYCYYMGYFQNSQSNLNKEASLLARRGVSKRRFDQPWCKEFPQRIPFVRQCVEAYEKHSELFAMCGNKWLGTVITYCLNENIYETFADPRCLYYLLQLDMADNLKMIIAYSAEGQTTPPLIINGNMSSANDFENMLMPEGWIKYLCEEPLNTRNQDMSLIVYLEHVLKPYLAEENITTPILLFHKYLFSPLSLAFFELCKDNNCFPINSHMQLSALKLHQSLQMEITFRMKSSSGKDLSTYVDLMKEILEVKLTEERLCESFRESGLYPLNIGDFEVEQLPRLQMRALEEEVLGDIEEPEVKEQKPYIVILPNQTDQVSDAVAGQKRTHEEDTSKPTSGVFKIMKTNMNSLPPESRPLPVCSNMRRLGNFQHIDVDDEDVIDVEENIIVCNEPSNFEHPLKEPVVQLVSRGSTKKRKK